MFVTDHSFTVQLALTDFLPHCRTLLISNRWEVLNMWNWLHYICLILCSVLEVVLEIWRSSCHCSLPGWSLAIRLKLLLNSHLVFQHTHLPFLLVIASDTLMWSVKWVQLLGHLVLSFDYSVVFWSECICTSWTADVDQYVLWEAWLCKISRPEIICIHCRFGIFLHYLWLALYYLTIEYAQIREHW